MEKKLLIIKFGGSVVTDKNNAHPTLRISAIRQLAKQLNTLYTAKQCQIILIHGAGSFGHPLAKRYGLHQGMQTKEQKIGFSLVSHKMVELSTKIVNILLEYSLPVVILPPHSLITQSEGKFQGFDLQIVGKYLNNGRRRWNF